LEKVIEIETSEIVTFQEYIRRGLKYVAILTGSTKIQRVLRLLLSDIYISEKYVLVNVSSSSISTLSVMIDLVDHFLESLYTYFVELTQCEEFEKEA